MKKNHFRNLEKFHKFFIGKSPQNYLFFNNLNVFFRKITSRSATAPSVYAIPHSSTASPPQIAITHPIQPPAAKRSRIESEKWEIFVNFQLLTYFQKPRSILSHIDIWTEERSFVASKNGSWNSTYRIAQWKIGIVRKILLIWKLWNCTMFFQYLSLKISVKL